MISAKRLCTLLIASCLCIATARFCHHQTHGFRLTKIQNNLYCEEVPLEIEPQDPAIAQILKQRFSYFNRGLQSFCFLSEDGQYVLKFFNNRYQRRIGVYEILSRLPFCSPWAKMQALTQRAKLKRTFASYRIAATKLKDETAILYAHLTPTTTLPSSLTLVDSLKIAHQINPNTLGFVVQKKATMAYPELLALIQAGNTKLLSKRIASLIDLLIRRCQLGIADNDPLIRTNFGFIGEHAVEIDIGPFSLDPSRTSPEIFQPEITRITQSLKNWLNIHGPEFLPILEQQLEEKVYSRDEMDP